MNGVENESTGDVRLVARTSDCRSENRGSIPLRPAMKTTFIKENVLCTLSKAEIGYLNYLVKIYDKSYNKKWQYMLQLIKENNYFYKIDGIHYHVLKLT